MNKLVAGQECYVSSLSEDKALENKVKAFFVGYRKNGAMIFEIDTNHALFTRQYAVPIPEQKLNPWTLETFPMGSIWVRQKGSDVIRLITSVDLESAFLSSVSWITFKHLSEEYERITNLGVEPCGVYGEN